MSTRHDSYSAVRHQRAARRRGNICMDGRRHQRSGDGRRHLTNFNVDAVRPSYPAPAMRLKSAAAHPEFTNILTRSGAAAFTIGLRVCAQLGPSDRAATTSTMQPRPIRAAFRPSAATSLDSPTGARFLFPTSTTAASAPSTSPVPGLSPGVGNTQVCRFPPCRARRHRYVTYPDGSVDTLTVPVDAGIAAALARYPLPNYAAGAFQAHNLRNRFEGCHRR